MDFRFLLLIPLLISSTVVYVVELARHGLRTPTQFMPWDEGIWSVGPGQLTPEGMRQHFLIGTELRNRYINNTKLLSSSYYKPEVSFYSTDYDRTLMSAMSQLSGLYPPETGPSLKNSSLNQLAKPPIYIENFNETIEELGDAALPNNIQVVPVFTGLNQDDIILLPSFSCPKYQYISNFNSNSSAVQSLIKKNANLFETISNVMDISIEEAINISPQLLDSLIINNAYGNTRNIPAPFNEQFLQQAVALSNQITQIIYYTPEVMSQLSGSQFLRQLSTLLNESQSNPNSTLKFSLFLAHDSSLLNVLSALKLPNLENPTFASTILFELISDENKNFYVQVYYNDILQTIPTCGSTLCPFYNFMRFIELRSFPNITNACIFNSAEENWGDLAEAENEEFPVAGKGDDWNLRWYGWLAIAFCSAVIMALGIAVTVLIRDFKAKRGKKKYVEMWER
ncbi:unnamed protein product [Blepharisma stoltei]|uniref:Acid phosphatase n=1 Tax=Blepharisma stoltei TaxID=1481888 RepID=A0AAU9K1W1_9CILI|nr:unnamed protein product [Blepharisma stoltei]